MSLLNKHPATGYKIELLNETMKLDETVKGTEYKNEIINPNKTGPFESSFFLGMRGQFEGLHISRKTNLISI